MIMKHVYERICAKCQFTLEKFTTRTPLVILSEVGWCPKCQENTTHRSVFRGRTLTDEWQDAV